MDIIENRKVFFTISLIIIVIGIFTMVIKGLNYGIDFTGGTLIQIDLNKQVRVNDIKKLMNDFDKDAHVIHAGADKEEVIIKSKVDFTKDQKNEIIEKFKEEYDLKDENFTQFQKFSPAMGKEIRNRALLSSFLAIVAMLIYITWRFEFKFAIAAILALLHDVLITISVYAIFRIPVNGSFIAAILTILGYSINDTIVIFDRIRENSKLMRKETEDVLVNVSVKESFKRSINTSITTLAAVVTLYIFGVEDIKVLAFPLMIGIIAGTYSSLFIASPLWYIFINKGRDKDYKPRRT